MLISSLNKIATVVGSANNITIRTICARDHKYKNVPLVHKTRLHAACVRVRASVRLRRPCKRRHHLLAANAPPSHWRAFARPFARSLVLIYRAQRLIVSRGSREASTRPPVYLLTRARFSFHAAVFFASLFKAHFSAIVSTIFAMFDVSS